MKRGSEVTNRRRVLLAGVAGLLAAGGGAFAFAQGGKEKVIKITARRFTYLPNQVTLKKGVATVLEFTSADVVMGFSAPDFNVRADIVPGQVARVRLVPDKVGTFAYICDIFCGDGHETMGGTIRVVA